MDIETIVAMIMDGTLDGEHERITDAIRWRKGRDRLVKAATMRVGQHVKLNDKCRPTYLIGQTGLITKVNQTTALVRFDNTLPGRFAHQATVRVPSSLFDVID
jgi:hypothetical protein